MPLRYAALAGLLLASTAAAQTWERIDPSAFGLTEAQYAKGFEDVHNADGTLLASRSVIGVEDGVFLRYDLHASTDGGETWSSLPTLPFNTGAEARIASHGDRWFNYSGANLVFTDDGGETWQRATGITGTFGSIFDVHVSDTAALMATADGLFVSADEGMTWTAVEVADFGRTVLETSEGTLLYGAIPGVFRSTDGGETWTQVFSGQDCRELFQLADGRIYAGMADRVYDSTDDGQTWTQTEGTGISPGITESAVRGDASLVLRQLTKIGYAASPATPLVDYADVSAGVPVDQGVSCARALALTDNAGFAAVQCYRFEQARDDVGVYRLNLGGSTSAEFGPDPLGVTVGPNPTADAVTVRVSGQLSGPVAVWLVDVLGRTVRTAEGADTLRLNVADLAPGVYVVVVQNGPSSTSRRITIAR